MIYVLQLGQIFSTCSHPFRHSWWKKCLQSSLMQSWPSANSSLQIVHLNKWFRTLIKGCTRFHRRTFKVLRIFWCWVLLTLFQWFLLILAIAVLRRCYLVGHVIDIDIVFLLFLVVHGSKFFFECFEVFFELSDHRIVFLFFLFNLFSDKVQSCFHFLSFLSQLLPTLL